MPAFHPVREDRDCLKSKSSPTPFAAQDAVEHHVADFPIAEQEFAENALAPETQALAVCRSKKCHP